MRSRVWIAALVAASVALRAPAAAQTAAADSGRAAAERAGTAGHVAGGFLGGILLGFGGAALAESERPHRRAALHAGIGAAVLTGLVVSADPGGLPRRVEDRLHALTPAEREAFRAAYAARVRERRTRASLLGGLAGTAVGASALVGLLQVIGS